MSKKTENKVVSRKDVTKAQWTLHMMNKNKIGYFMIAPFMILFLIFTVIPVVLSLILSFTSFNMIEFPKFIFMQNYITLFLEDELFIGALKYTMIFAIIIGPVSYVMSFIVAWFINELPPKIRAVVTLIFYAPSIAGNAYVIWTTFFSGDRYGWLNAWLMKLGFISEPVLWTRNTKYMVPICIIVALWMSLGVSFLSFIAGLQGVNRSLYEAGAIDGITNRWQEVWYITLPSMKPQLMFGAVMSITGAFGFGDVVSSLCGNPPTDYVGYTVTHHINEYGSVRWEVGYSAALSFLMFLIMIGANLLVNKMLQKVGQ
ncbi:MAG: sugar ABC transporter permease [Clostridia bacterium]|nr:sugar ABC transporter permease [Clostridia bacterium]